VTRPIVLLDVDGPLALFVEACQAELAGHGVYREAAAVKTFRLEEAWSLSPDQKQILARAYKRPGFCAGIAPREKAREAVERLRGIADVYAVTAPMWSGPTWQHERTEWLVDHFGFQRDHVVSTSAKYLVGGDVLVDDRAETLVMWERHGRASGVGVLWAMPHNFSAWANGEWDGDRTSDWQVVINLAERLAGARDPQEATRRA